MRAQEVVSHRRRPTGELEVADVVDLEQTHTWFTGPGVAALESGPWTEAEDLALAQAFTCGPRRLAAGQ